ncbi:hemolysin family protein [Nocardioides lianchengensis]|uniref:Hemolysin, contains CBS domains n=1 Tax=Nocardioides lianchengensis TaxID=1045774 RepID=A0A1G6WTV6_9ACTN|nr:hemolysin family protein [Nocardioides lianchengensis]NYG09200.1 CBS domain containing-hemolysin-like protein [Nocardioides lianchengensis]SDD69312.1 Hemolysin, contains CBS domains [Nocardioides lianchengensis]
MSSGDLWLLVSAAALVVLAGAFSAAEAALASFSHARAEELVAEKRPGAKRLLGILDDAARYLNTALFLRLLCEISAIVLVAQLVDEALDGEFWVSTLVAIGVMLVVSFVVIGVAPRTMGRQHSETIALWSAGPLTLVTRVLGPLPRLLILIGNALTPGRGFSQGPFSTETELRELVDLAEASALIESGERKMIHSVFELGDTTVREVMVPRNDVVYVERHKNLRQTMSLFLRSGFSRVPVVGENLDNIVGFAYLKDIVRRDFEAPDAETTERIESVMRSVHWVPESKPVDALLREMQARRQHIAVVVDEYGGTAGIITIEDLLEEIVGEITDEYDEEEIEVEQLVDGIVRVSSRYPVDDLDELFGFQVEEEDVDSVGGLMAKHLGLVPIPGSAVEAHGLRFVAEDAAGRRNKIGTVLIARVETPDDESDPVDRNDKNDKNEDDADD